MRFSKDDIQKAYKTTPIEESLLVFQSTNDTSSYVEYAILALTNKRLSEVEIKRWIDSIERLKDCYLYEQNNPIRIRLKNSFNPISIIHKPEFTNVEQVNTWVLEQDHPFNVQKPPLFHIYLIETKFGQYFCLVYHHLLFDGISIQLALSALDINSKLTFSDWNPKTQSVSPEKIELTPFSLERLVPPPVVPEQGYIRKSFELENVSYEAFMMEWLRYLKQASGLEEIIIGEVFSARDETIESSTALGYFVQTWPIRVHSDLSSEQLAQTRQAIKAKATGWVKDHYTPNAFDHCWVVEPSLNAGIEAYFYSKPHYVLTIVLSPKGNNLTVNFCWNLEKIDRDAALEICTSFVQSLTLQCAPKLRLTHHEPRLHSLLARWEEMVQHFPLNVAIEDHLGTVLNYIELDEESDRLAARLTIKKGACVGVYTSYSASIPIAFLAILKRGGIYVPLDPTVSADRREFIIENAGIEVIISDLNPSFKGNIIDPTKRSNHTNYERINNELTDTCYLIYTSGTTGIPKGCAVNHLNLLNLFEGSKTLFSFKPEDRWILAHSYGFDFSTWEIWGALLNGAKLFIPDRKEVQDTFKFHKLLQEKRVNILNQTPKSFYNLMLVDKDLDQLTHIDYVIFGGDKLHSNRLTAWMKTYPNMSIVNMYGITETTVHVTFHKVQPELQSNIGMALPGYEICLMNEEGTMVPPGFLGEIYVYGKGVCNGYYQNPLLTEEKFAENELGRHYKSGDLAWQIGDSYYYLGRRDRQVKIRGFRIELGEIENSLKQTVNQCDFTVLFIDEKLIAFYKGGVTDLTPDRFRGILADYAIPSLLIQVPEFPLNQSGKIDEKALMASITKTSRANAISPWSAYFKEILGSNIDGSRSFLQNGGDSILAIRLINRLKKEGFQLSVQELFSENPIDELNPINISAAANTEDFVKAFHEKKQLNYSPEHFYFPLLESQQGILFDCLKSENPSLYVEQLTYEISSKYRPDDLYRAYQQVCEAQPLLRSRIARKQENYLMEVATDHRIDCQILHDVDFESFKTHDFERGFNLEQNLTRLSIIPGAEVHRIIWTHHHLILDGWSLGIFSQQMLQALENKKLVSSDSFIAFCCKQSLSSLPSSYWREQLDQQENDPLIPYLGARHQEKEYQKTTAFIPFTEFQKLQQLNLSQHGFMLAAWSSFLGLLFDKKALHIANVISLRDESAMEEMGMYIRSLPFQLSFNSNHSFIEFSAKVFAKSQIDQANANAPMNAYLKGNQFNHLFVFENYPVDYSTLEHYGIRIGAFQERTGASWSTIVYPKEGGFELAILHETRFYASKYVHQILRHFSRWLSDLVWDQPMSKSISAFSPTPLISGEIVQHSTTSVLDLLKRESINPILIGTSRITYTKCWSEAELLARNLKIIPGEAVGIDVQSTYHFTQCILAIWMAQGVACPVDRRYPAQRKNFIFHNSEVRIILQSNSSEITLEHRDIAAFSHGTEASFILHTSGSTGEPKGVIQTHACLINLISWNARSFELNQNEVILQLSSFGFDASFHEVLLAMALGATLVEVPLEDRLDAQKIRANILQHKATLGWIPARLLNAVLEGDSNFFEACTSLKNIVTTGEALVIGGELKSYLERSTIRLLNFYGPTETHVITAQPVNASQAITQPSIGKVLPNTTLALMVNGAPVPEGLPGEIWATGDHLAIGYLKDEQQTQLKFPIFHEQRFYATGDWAFIDEDKKFHFIGRKDDQLKIRGFRVEPLEVERLLTEIDEIKECCVLVHQNALHAFVVTSLALEALRSKAHEGMPDFMVPEVFHPLTAMPMNSNGKADRGMLKELIKPMVQSSVDLNRNLLSIQCWIDVLGHDQFNITDRFDQVGGNSILLMKMQAWLEKKAGCFVSVKSLIEHNTPNLLENLLQNERSFRDVLLPSAFPLNNLQRAILLTELANDWGGQSPFILRFTVKLQQIISETRWKEAVGAVLVQFPYLTYGLDQVYDPKNTAWTQTENSNKVFTEDYFSQWSDPLIRFRYINSSNIELVYHHILLDGLGMNVLLNRLLDHLDDKTVNYGNPNERLLNTHPKKTAFNVQTLSKRAVKLFTEISGEEYQSVQLHCKGNALSNREFWLISVAVAHQAPLIAYANVNQHPGIPGMFTELDAFSIDLLSETEIPWNKEELTTSIVANYQMLEIPQEWVEKVEVSEPTITKYPFEWQFIDYGNRIEITLYTADGSTGQVIFDAWRQRISNALFNKSTVATNKEDLFDDFDF